MDGLGLRKINQFRVTFGRAIFALGMSGLVCYKEILSVSVMVGCASLWGVVLFTLHIYKLIERLFVLELKLLLFFGFLCGGLALGFN